MTGATRTLGAGVVLGLVALAVGGWLAWRSFAPDTASPASDDHPSKVVHLSDRHPAPPSPDTRAPAGNSDDRIEGTASQPKQGASGLKADLSWTLRVQILRRSMSGTVACAFVDSAGVVIASWRAEPGIEHFIDVKGSGRVVVDGGDDGVWATDTVTSGFTGVLVVDARQPSIGGAAIEGTVWDPSGLHPVANVALVATTVVDTATLDDSDPQWSVRKVSSGLDGTFRIPCLPTGRVKVRATPMDPAQGRPVESVMQANSKGVRLVLEPVCQLSFLLEDANTGLAASGPEIEILALGEGKATRVFFCEYPPPSAGSKRPTRVRISVAPGAMAKYQIKVAGYGDEVVEVAVTPESHYVEVPVRLLPAPDTIVEVEFVISSESQSTVTRVNVTRDSDGHRTARMLSPLNGVLAMRLTAGRHELTFEALDPPDPRYLLPKHVSLVLERGAGSLRIPVELQLGGYVCVVAPSDYLPGEWATPAAGGPSVRMNVMSKRAAEGRAFQIGPLPPGQWNMEFSRGAQPETVSVKVIAGSMTEVKVRPSGQ